MGRSAEGFDDLSDHIAGNRVAELKRLRQRELDLLEERRKLRAEVASQESAILSLRKRAGAAEAELHRKEIRR